MNRFRAVLLLAAALITPLAACAHGGAVKERPIVQPIVEPHVEPTPAVQTEPAVVQHRPPKRLTELLDEPTPVVDGRTPVDTHPPVVDEPPPVVVEPPPVVVAGATCETAAHQAVLVLNPSTYGEQDVIDECHRDSWSQALIDCYTNAADFDSMQPCFLRHDAEMAVLRLNDMNVNLAAADTAAMCYADGDGHEAYCADACEAGFPGACVAHAAHATDDAAREAALARSCDVAFEMLYLDPADLPLDEAAWRAEMTAGYGACRELGAPLVADVYNGDASLARHVESACYLSVKLGDGTAMLSCADYALVADAFGLIDAADWAYDTACLAGNDEACYLLDMW